MINYERARPVHAACLDNPHGDSAAKPAGTSTRFSLPRTRDKKVVCLRFLYTLIAGCDAKSSAARSISPARIAFTPIRPWARYAIALMAQRSVIISRSEEHTSELQSLMRISYAVFCLKK